MHLLRSRGSSSLARSHARGAANEVPATEAGIEAETGAADATANARAAIGADERKAEAGTEGSEATVAGGIAIVKEVVTVTAIKAMRTIATRTEAIGTGTEIAIETEMIGEEIEAAEIAPAVATDILRAIATTIADETRAETVTADEVIEVETVAEMAAGTEAEMAVGTGIGIEAETATITKASDRCRGD